MALCTQLLLLRSLVSIDLSGCLLDDQLFAAAVQALSCSAQLQRLHLARCAPGQSGLRALAGAMQRWSLREFDL